MAGLVEELVREGAVCGTLRWVRADRWAHGASALPTFWLNARLPCGCALLELQSQGSVKVLKPPRSGAAASTGCPPATPPASATRWWRSTSRTDGWATTQHRGGMVGWGGMGVGIGKSTARNGEPQAYEQITVCSTCSTPSVNRFCNPGGQGPDCSFMHFCDLPLQRCKQQMGGQLW